MSLTITADSYYAKWSIPKLIECGVKYHEVDDEGYSVLDYSIMVYFPNVSLADLCYKKEFVQLLILSNSPNMQRRKKIISMMMIGNHSGKGSLPLLGKRKRTRGKALRT